MAVLKEKIVSSLLMAHKGNMANVARECGVTRQAVQDYVSTRPKLQTVIRDCRESIKDLCESQLFKKIEKGNMHAITYYLDKQARDRGYVDRREIETSGTLRLELVEEIVHVDCITTDSQESLEAPPSPIGLLPEPSEVQGLCGGTGIGQDVHRSDGPNPESEAG